MTPRPQGLILAAGNGSRISALTSGLPKGLLTVGWGTLLGHQYHAMRLAGIERIAMVIGSGAEHVRAAFGDSVEYIHNPRYKETNSLCSLALARPWVDSPLVVMNCDVLIHPRVVADLARAQGCALAFDSTSGGEAEHMKVSVHDGLVRAVNKRMDPALVSGENVGLLRFDRDGVDALFDAARQIIAEGGQNAWAPAAVDRIAASRPVHAIDIAGVPWCEVDFPEDAAFARERVWPAVRQAYEGRSNGTPGPTAHKGSNGRVKTPVRAGLSGRPGAP